MNFKNNIALLAALILLFTGGVSAQDFRARLDSSKILIGSQTALKVEVLLKEGKKVRFPILPDTLSQGLEVVAQFAADTSKAKNGALLLTKRYILTSYDSGSYVVPRIPVLYFDGAKVDTLLTQPITLKVNTVAVDSTKRPLYGIKGNIKAPYTWEEIAMVILAALLLIGIIVAVVLYFRKNREQPIFTFKKKVVEPAHVIAFRELEQLKNRKLWQNGHNKEYFSQLTDILRKYLEERMKINAMEMTSPEIIAALKNLGYGNKTIFERLMVTMSTSDLVKFAKYTSDPIENDQAMKCIYDFVDDTKEVLVVEQPNNGEEPSSSVNK